MQKEQKRVQKKRERCKREKTIKNKTHTYGIEQTYHTCTHSFIQRVVRT